jgi:hypothetical protein
MLELEYNIISKNTICCLLTLSLLLLARCKEPEPDPPEVPPTIIIVGQNPLKTGIYLSFVDDSVNIYTLSGLDSVSAKHNIDTSLLGYYQISYYARSLSGMTAEAQRDVWVVVKPKSMNGLWDVSLSGSSDSFTDSLCVENKKLTISNLNNILGLKVELSLAANLQDSVYIFEQYLSDSLYCVFGSGTIDERAMNMVLDYSIVENSDTTVFHSVYSRDSISTQ